MGGAEQAGSPVWRGQSRWVVGVWEGTPVSLLHCLTPDVWLRNGEGFSWVGGRL